MKYKISRHIICVYILVEINGHMDGDKILNFVIYIYGSQPLLFRNLQIEKKFLKCELALN